MRNVRTLTALLLIAAIAGCMHETPYQPMKNGEGYLDQKIESNRYRIRFTGNSATPRETVETYLLYRAAELTLQNGYDYFILGDQHTTGHDTYYQSFGIGGGFGRYYWGPRWGVDTVHVDTEYEGRITIVMVKGQKKEGDAKAFDAREVKANLEPEVVRPERKS